MAKHDDGNTDHEIANLRFAASSLRDAAHVMEAQRDEARSEARALRHLTRVAVVALLAAVLLVAAAAASGEGPWEARDDDSAPFIGSVIAPLVGAEEGVRREGAGMEALRRLAKVDRVAAEEAALRAIPGVVHSTRLTEEGGYVVYEVMVADGDGRPHEVTVDAGNGAILDQNLSEEGFDEDL